MKLVLQSACGCNIGKKRRNNEDNFYFNGHCLPKENRGLSEILKLEYQTDSAVDFAIFDGIGGHADGQIASGIAASIFAAAVNKITSENPSDFLSDTVRKMSDAVRKNAEVNHSNMGTTASVLHFAEDTYYACNVGDSPVFLFRDNDLTEIYEEHTNRALLEKTGNVKKKPSLTQYIGISPEELCIEPYSAHAMVKPGDCFLICSDGLTEMVPRTVIAEILAESLSPEKKVSALIEAALNGGGKDNITVIVIEVKSVNDQTDRDSLTNANSEQTGNRRNGTFFITVFIVLIILAIIIA